MPFHILHLPLHSRLETAVQIGELGSLVLQGAIQARELDRLRLERVVILLGSGQRPDSSQELRGVKRLVDEILRHKLERLNLLLLRDGSNTANRRARPSR